jgi:hypothetical protein
MTRGESGRRCEEIDCACCVGLKPKQIKYLNSTAARLQSNEKEEMVRGSRQDAEACRSESGDEENEQVVESNPTRRRNRIPAEIVHITSVASSSATRGLP